MGAYLRVKTDIRELINKMTENQAKQLAILLALRWPHETECAIYKAAESCSCGSDVSLAKCVEEILTTEKE